MITKTFPYGTTRTVKVQSVFERESGMALVVCIDEVANEAYVLTGDKGACGAKEGEAATLTFTKGGPTGGYWKFSKATSEAPK